MPKGTCSLEEFSARLAAGTAARDGNAQGNSTTLSQREIIDTEIVITEKLSHDLGLWIPMEETSLLGIPFLGFGKSSVYPIVCQDYIPNATYATHGEILDYMESLGFQTCGDATFTNGSIVINDLRPRNVLKTPNGALFVIDADFKF